MTLAPTPPEAFRIGVRPLGEDAWLVVDDHLCAYLAEKERRAAERFGDIFMAEPETESAQAEILARVVDAQLARHPDAFARVENGLCIRATGQTVRFDDSDTPPLWTAARLCQEDLVLMRRGDSGWRLAAAALSFPSAWSLREKFGRPMDEIHAPVPDFGAGTRNAMMIARMFDNLRPETPVLRWNWGLYGDSELFHPGEHAEAEGRFGPEGDQVFVRLERQTLTRLTGSGDILFSIRIFVDPLPVLAREDGGRDVMRALKSQIAGFTPAQTAYKGLSRDKERLIAQLTAYADEAAGGLA